MTETGGVLAGSPSVTTGVIVIKARSRKESGRGGRGCGTGSGDGDGSALAVDVGGAVFAVSAVVASVAFSSAAMFA